MSDQTERVIRLETLRETDRQVVIELREKLDEVHTDVQDIKAVLGRQKGFVAGMLFILVPIWGAIAAMVASLWDRFMNTGDLP
jgi:hypothetical protein